MATPDRPIHPTAFALGLFLGSSVFLLLVLAINVLTPAWIIMLLLGALASWGVGSAWGYPACVLLAIVVRIIAIPFTMPRTTQSVRGGSRNI